MDGNLNIYHTNVAAEQNETSTMCKHAKMKNLFHFVITKLQIPPQIFYQWYAKM